MTYLEDLFREGTKHHDAEFKERMTAQMEVSPAHKDYYGALLTAREQVIYDGLRLTYTTYATPEACAGEVQFTIAQGMKATCGTHEDVIAILQVQLPILSRLDLMLSRLDQASLLHNATVDRLDLALGRIASLHRLVWVAIGLLIIALALK